jgi:hypothetical protein
MAMRNEKYLTNDEKQLHEIRNGKRLEGKWKKRLLFRSEQNTPSGGRKTIQNVGCTCRI